mmetsp:Transcript_46237/g.122623  ORF Transcript_46237/g.122623 Transcript_46237/m.122623 type:complete len:166 (+) Transcript_46237:161-658(+)
MRSRTDGDRWWSRSQVSPRCSLGGVPTRDGHSERLLVRGGDPSDPVVGGRGGSEGRCGVIVAAGMNVQSGRAFVLESARGLWSSASRELLALAVRSYAAALLSTDTSGTVGDPRLSKDAVPDRPRRDAEPTSGLRGSASKSLRTTPTGSAGALSQPPRTFRAMFA